MRRHALTVILVLVASWLASQPPGALSIDALRDFWPVRRQLLLGTGFVAIGCMSIAMVLAARPVRLERMLGGLDQFYRLHRRLGIAGALFGVAHWLLANGPRWAAGQGVLLPPRQAGRGAGAPASGYSHDIAGALGEWGLYLVLALVVVALWKRIPYHWFARLHKAMPIGFLMLAYHSVVLMPAASRSSLAGWLGAALVLGGVLASVLSLAGRIGFRRRALGHVASLRLHEDRVLEVHCQLDTSWGGHESGQFVFVTFHPDEGAHPFTVVSPWAGDGHLVLAIKELGDYTRSLPRRLSRGDPVVVEGPYGCFTFEGRYDRQVWIAGGIGIAPFISRLEWLARAEPIDGGRGDIDLFFSTDEEPEPLTSRLRELAAASGVRLHVIVPPRDGFLTSERVARAVDDLRQAEVWFCGPKGFGDAMRKGLVRLGLRAECFHQEAFRMR